MAEKTFIEWADATWNPWYGCTKVSPGCDNCYAQVWANRAGNIFSKVRRCAQSSFTAPIRWKQARRIFVCSLSDFFHPDVTRQDRADAIRVMTDAPRHTYMLLTKRPENIKRMLAGTAWENGLPDNVWLGVTAENQEQADKRIPLLLEIPAKVRFVSCEPLLGPVSLHKIVIPVLPTPEVVASPGYQKLLQEHIALGGSPSTMPCGKIEKKVDWVICGGESGPNARPMHPDWSRSLREQCAAEDVPFFFKQWGEWYPDRKGIYENVESAIFGDTSVHRVGKKAAGCLLDGKEHKELPV